MRKKKVLIAILLIVVLSASTVLAEAGQAYEGTSTYDNLYKNINFKDVKNHWAEKYINTMSALSIIKGMGKQHFNPNEKLTHEQALILLVRLMGLGQEAQQKGQDMVANIDTAGYNILTAYDYWIKGYIDTAINNSIITQEEVNLITNINQTTTERINDEVDSKMASYEPNFNITQTQLNNIRKQLKEKITRKYTWQKTVNREKVAIWTARIMNLEPITGSEQQNVYNLKDWKDISPSNLSLIEAVLQSGIMSGNNRGEFKPKASLTRAEMTKIMYQIARPLLQKNGYKINTGMIENIEESIFTNSDPLTGRTYAVVGKTLRIKNDVGIQNIYIQESKDEIGSKGFIFIDGKHLSTMDKLKNGDYIRYYIDPNDKVILAERLDANNLVLDVFIEKVEDKYITFKDFNDITYKFELANGANVLINGNNIPVEDLLYGQEVSVKLVNDKITLITGELETGDEGYIQPGDKIYTGKVLSKDKYSRVVTLTTPDEVKQFTIDGYAHIIKDGENVNFDAIKDGDYLRLEFDEYDTNKPLNVYISSADIQIASLYKAQLQDVITARSQIILGELNLYNHGSWTKQSGKQAIQISSNCKIYTGNTSLSLEDLKQYTGNEAYVAVENNFGQNQIIRLVMKNDYETKYNNSIQNIEYGANTLKVDYTKVGFDYDSTIIVKDNRLIHPYNLKKGDDILVYSYGVSNPHAAFISVQDVDTEGVVVYRGRIDDIGQYKIDLDKIDILESNNWQHESKQTTFKISNDTKIIDTRGAEVKAVSVDDFLNSKYLKEDDKDNNYYKKYAYAVEYNNMIIALNIISNDTKAQVISTATVEKIDKANISLNLKNVKDYSFFKKKWNLNETSLDLTTQKCIFIKNGKIVSYNHVKKGDSLYILRKNSRGDIIIIK